MSEKQLEPSRQIPHRPRAGGCQDVIGAGLPQVMKSA